MITEVSQELRDRIRSGQLDHDPDLLAWHIKKIYDIERQAENLAELEKEKQNVGNSSNILP